MFSHLDNSNTNNGSGCFCTSYTTRLEYKRGRWRAVGNCVGKVGKGPICYVEEPSTCSDLQRSKKYSDKRYSWEACEKRQGNLSKLLILRSVRLAIYTIETALRNSTQLIEFISCLYFRGHF